MKNLFSLLLLLSVSTAAALEVIEAKFGAGDRWAEVTEAFKKLRVHDDLYIGWIDGNKMAGKDPAPGVAKKLTVKYKDHGGTIRTRELAERTIDGIVANQSPTEEFTLAQVWFGDHGKFVDVTGKLQAVVAENREVKLDFPTLGLDASQDPLPGKKKMVVFFYSLDGKTYCRQLWEGDRFKGSMIAPLYDPIPAAKGAISPFAGMELDKAVWQWAIPMRAVSSENNLPAVAYLYIPPKTAKLRGLVLGMFNMLELPIMEHPAFRETLQKLDYGCVWIAPTPFGANFNFNNPEETRVMDALFEDLAKASGYAEIADIPFIGIGHSAMAAFPWQLAMWKPERAICGISYDGSTPGVDYHYKFNDPVMNREAVARLKGIPMLIRDGEYSGGRSNRRPQVLAQQVPGLLVTLVADPGSGHFDINDKIIDYIGFYLEKADKARNTGKLRPVDYSSGWNVDYWRVDSPPAAPAAPVAGFKAKRNQYGEEKLWVFDEEHARYHEAYQARERGKKVQLLGYRQDGQILPDRKSHAQIHPAFKPEADGLSIKLQGTFIDTVTEGRAAGWSGKKAGSPVEHGADPENINVYPICGPVVRLDHETMAVRFYRFGFTSSRRTGEIYMMAVHPGDATYRRSVLQSVMMVPRSRDKGIAQRIDFPAIPDQPAGTSSYKLNARANTGMPVEYYVEYGPAYLKDGELIFTEIPAGAKNPVEVSVVAWQYGREKDPAIQSAAPVNRKFKRVQ